MISRAYGVERARAIARARAYALMAPPPQQQLLDDDEREDLNHHVGKTDEEIARFTVRGAARERGRCWQSVACGAWV